jgi:hypothetical protein
MPATRAITCSPVAAGIALTAIEGSEPSQKAPKRRNSLLNLHRMKQFQRPAGPLDALERRHRI